MRLPCQESPSFRAVSQKSINQAAAVHPLNNSRLSQADAAVLCAMNVADQYYQQVQSETNLRAQLKEALEEAAKLKLEASELKREIFKLQNKR